VDTFEERRKFVEELKKQWKTLWRDRIDDKVRAEGISDKDYSQLFIERGTVIMATRKFKPPDFYEIIQHYLSSELGVVNSMLPLNPTVGGWRKFIRNMSRQQSLVRQRRSSLMEPVKKENQQLKKGGRGWLHFKR